MILRIWNGYTTKENAASYEKLLETEIATMIAQKEIKGYRRMQILRRELEDETQFTTIMWFEEIQSIIDFMGEDYEVAHIPEIAKAVLSRYDKRSVHHELRNTLDYEF